MLIKSGHFLHRDCEREGCDDFEEPYGEHDFSGKVVRTEEGDAMRTYYWGVWECLNEVCEYEHKEKVYYNTDGQS